MAQRRIPTMVGDEYWIDSAFSLCVSEDGRVHACGYTKHGAIGILQNSCVLLTQIVSIKNIQAVSCGTHHSVFLDYNGNVFSIGSNMNGRLGIDKSQDELNFTCEPQKINLPKISQISCGSGFTICLSEEGNLYSFGYCDYGGLGLGETCVALSPQRILSLDNVDFVECGGNHAFCKTLNNEIYSWGYNYFDQLGIGNRNDQFLPVKCSGWPDIIDIKCGHQHTLALSANQETYACGNNYSGQLGREPTTNVSLQMIENLPEILQIGCGTHYSMCIDIEYNFYVFGDNSFGQLGLGDTTNRFTPTKNPYLSPVIDFSGKGNHTFVKTMSNEIYAFGWNYKLELGIQTESTLQLTPIQVFQGKEDIWHSDTSKFRIKSARK